jgi:hypothetical protein
MSLSDKAVLSTKEAWLYVGGRPFFEQMVKAYPDILKPIRESRNEAGSKTKSQYLRSIIDTALKAAQLSQSFVAH